MTKRTVSTPSATSSLLGPILVTLCLSLAIASPSPGQQTSGDRCPTGVLDEARAYFGSLLGANACDSQGKVCQEVLFLSDQRHGTAVCSGGRWLLRDEASTDHDVCPQFVFADGQIWRHGSFAPNTCDTESAQQAAQHCDRTYFYRLPGGGAGYHTATCVGGQWRPADEQGGDEPFRLRQVRSESELVGYLRQGLRETYGGNNYYLYGFPLGCGVCSPPSPGVDLTVSQTNVQEAGVDEEDRIKSDGQHLFILENHQSRRQPAPPNGSRNRVRILEIDAGQPSAGEIATLDVTTASDQWARGLYFRTEASQLVVTGSSNPDLGWPYWYSPLAWIGATSTVASIDVSQPAFPVHAATLEVEGQIISSRRIGDFVYLATRFQPQIQGLQPFDPNGPEAPAEIARIEAAELDDLTPSYRSTVHPAWRPLVQPSNCYLPTEEAPILAADVISLVAIDLDTLEVASSRCFVGATETLYVSPESVYVASTRYEYSLIVGDDGAPWTDYWQPRVETDLHKFSLSNGLISYRASGVVDGNLGWNILRKPFRLSESGADLRVITYTDELTADRSPVAVSVLRDTGDDELEILARLPNAQRPEPIGKPGEQLYATRFVGDRAYLVTFLVTDPLYVIDLSTPEDPRVAGELEITGYSDYLHPIDDDYVLGIGKDAIPDDFSGFRGAWYQGLKVSLYDVRDPNRPFETDAVILGKRGSEAPVLQDHRAFTFLQPEGGNPRVAIGTEVHDRLPPGTSVNPWTFFQWSYSGLHLFEVDTAAGRIISRGAMRVEEYGPGPGGGFAGPPIHGDDRSVLAGDAIFYVHGDDVYTSFWNDPGSFAGPK